MCFFKAKRQEALLEASQEEEASAPDFESLKRPGGHVARGLTNLCGQPFMPAAHKAIAVMAKSDDNDNYHHNVISSHLLV